MSLISCSLLPLFPSTTMSLSPSAAAYHRNQISIPSLTCNNDTRSRYASLSPPPPPEPASALKSHRRYHPACKMSHSISHPGTTSSACMMMMMRSPPISPPPGKGHTSTSYHSPPTSPLYQYSNENTTTRPTTNSLQERRQRNKAASAKYRQKKNMQQHEMRTMICQISERNASLERQLQEIRQENQKLRATADKLRGQLMASKLLDQWMQKHPKQQQQAHINQLDMDAASINLDDEELLMYDL